MREAGEAILSVDPRQSQMGNVHKRPSFSFRPAPTFPLCAAQAFAHRSAYRSPLTISFSIHHCTDYSYSPSGGNKNPHSQMMKNHPWCFFGLSEIFCGTRAGIAGDGRAGRCRPVCTVSRRCLTRYAGIGRRWREWRRTRKAVMNDEHGGGWRFKLERAHPDPS